MMRTPIIYPRCTKCMISNPYGYIYVITNTLNGKQYVGQHKGTKLDHKYWGSGELILFAIKKYGLSNFKREILDWCDSLQELNKREKFWIKQLGTFSKHGYNLSEGGAGITWTPEVRAKWSKSMSGENNPNYGVGVTWTDEARKNASIAASKRTGKLNSFYGKHHTDEWKEKYRNGVNNPMAKSVYMYSSSGKFIQEFSTVKSAIAAGFPGVGDRCQLRVNGEFKNKRVPYKGFLWSYLKPINNTIPDISFEPKYKSNETSK